MTKVEAIDCLIRLQGKLLPDINREDEKLYEMCEVVIGLLEEEIDKENSPCYMCTRESCKYCLYNGRID